MNTDNEPITLTEAIRVVILSVIGLLTAFNAWNPTAEQIGAILGVFAAVSIALSVFARMRSTPTSKVALTVDEADALHARDRGESTLATIGWIVVIVAAVVFLIMVL